MSRTKETGKKVSITDVARLAGVSQATASRVFDPKWEGKIRPKTREAVLQAASELKYYGTNAFGRGLQNGKSRMIALVSGRDTGYFYQDVIMKFVRRLHASGFQTLVFEADARKNIGEIIADIHCYQAEAVIITAAAVSAEIVDSFAGTDIPVIVFNRPVRENACCALYSDGEQAAGMAAEFLFEAGHRSFAVISGNRNPSAERGRVAGFCKRMEDLGGQILAVEDGDYRYESGYEIASELLDRIRPDAIFCVEDSIAMGAIDAAREKHGLRVPDDISVMGFDNLSIGRMHAYSLTTLAHPVDRMAVSAAEMLSRLSENPRHIVQKKFEMNLVVRGSVLQKKGSAESMGQLAGQ